MIIKFKKFNLIKESPDTMFYDNKKYGIDNGYGDMPFFCRVNKNHTKADHVYIGNVGDYHGDLPWANNRSYPGRLWLDPKIITFWVFPNIELFKSIIHEIEEQLDIKMFNNGWRIEIIKVNNKIDIINYDPSKPPNDYYFGDSDEEDYELELISLDNYIGSEDMPEELKQLHLMNWKEKEIAKKKGLLNRNFGSSKTAWDQPNNIRYRQQIYQEKKHQR